MAKQRTYIAIDLKSFYASVECKERNRDPLTTNFVVADKSRTEKTICLTVSPSLKSCGIPGRTRLFEVVQKVREANNKRRWKATNRTFSDSSDDKAELDVNPALEIDYIVAPPRMAYYMEYSTKIYNTDVCWSKNLQDLSEVCCTGRHISLFYRRSIYDVRLSANVSYDRKRTCYDDDTKQQA